MKWLILTLLFISLIRPCPDDPKGRTTEETIVSNTGIMEPDPEVAAVASRVQEIIRLALDRQCGSCHNSMNATAKAKALDIFDTRLENWSLNKLTEHLPGLETRTFKGTSFSEKEKEAIQLFISMHTAS